MRKCLLFLALSVLWLLPAQASAERKLFAFGLLGGMSGSAFWGSDVEAFDVHLWPTGGVSATFNLPVMLAFELEALYSYKGGVLKRKNPDRNNDLKLTFLQNHYIEVPFLVKLSAPTGMEAIPIFFIGPSYSWKIAGTPAGEFPTTEGGVYMGEPAEPDISAANLRDDDLSLVIGGGLEWGLGTLHMRANLGQQSLDRTGALDVRTVGLSIMAGFIF